MINVVRVQKEDALWNRLIHYAGHCSWAAGKHLAAMLRENSFREWESVFAALLGDEIIGYCTLPETDYYPENRYSPWIGSVFVDEKHRGNRVSQKLIEAAAAYAKTQHFSRVYIPASMLGFYEKYGFVRIDELVNYAGDTDFIFARDI